MMGKSTSHIILVLVSGFCKFLEFRHDQVIASGTFSEWTHIVMNFLTSVHTQYYVRHLFITEFHNFIIQKYSVCGQCETEFLIMKLFLLSAVFYQVFYNLPVHQRLAAKEIHFQVSSGTGIGDQEIKSFLSDFIGHQGSSAMIFSLFGKTIAAGQIAVMRNVQAQCFYNGLPVV